MRVLLVGKGREVIPRGIWLGNAVFQTEHPFWQKGFPQRESSAGFPQTA